MAREGRGARGSTPPSSPTAEAECKIDFAHSEMAVREGFSALERLMGKLNPAEAGGDRFYFSVCVSRLFTHMIS